MQNIEINPNKEYILCADISGSMATVDSLCGGNKRYNYMLEKFKSFVNISSDFDEHGKPTIILFGEKVHIYEHCDLNEVDMLLNREEFEGFTNLDLAINEAYKIHKEEKREQAAEKKFHPGTVVMIFTDGEPTNRPAVKRCLQKIVNEIDSEEEFHIILLTVGTRTKELQKWLEDLHEDLENKSINPNDYDIIHIEKLEDINFMEAIALNKHKE